MILTLVKILSKIRARDMLTVSVCFITKTHFNFSNYTSTVCVKLMTRQFIVANDNAQQLAPTGVKNLT